MGGRRKSREISWFWKKSSLASESLLMTFQDGSNWLTGSDRDWGWKEAKRLNSNRSNITQNGRCRQIDWISSVLLLLKCTKHNPDLAYGFLCFLYNIEERKTDKQVFCFVRLNKDNGGVQRASLQGGSSLVSSSVEIFFIIIKIILVCERSIFPLENG